MSPAGEVVPTQSSHLVYAGLGFDPRPRPASPQGPRQDERYKGAGFNGAEVANKTAALITATSYLPSHSIRVPVRNAVAPRRKSVLP
jgi:hypothetical protein